MTQDSHILSVSGLTEAIKGNLEGAFPFVWVRGQVMNVSRPGSGHVYFSLRDDGASIAAVWFRVGQKSGDRFDPLTGEVYEQGPRPSLAHTLENGQEIVCAGRLAVYAPRGQYQLVVELAQDVGLGRLHAEFERLKEKLNAAGYFATERKRALPVCPRRVAVVTAPQGAAVHDFLRRADERGIGAEIRIYPALMQGDAAPGQICRCLAAVQAEGWAEVAVLIRGGGSLEDLWAFNTEIVTKAVKELNIPVIAGIGHEVDFSLTDMTADVRAATPTHAAQLLWPERAELFSRLAVIAEGLERSGRQSLDRSSAALAQVERELFWRSPWRVLERWQERLVMMGEKLHKAALRGVEQKSVGMRALRAIVLRQPDRLPRQAALLENFERRLQHAGERYFATAVHSLERVELRLAALNPHAPLERGYALVRKADGIFVRGADMVNAGERLRVLVRDGEIPVRVEGEKA